MCANKNEKTRSNHAAALCQLCLLSRGASFLPLSPFSRDIFFHLLDSPSSIRRCLAAAVVASSARLYSPYTAGAAACSEERSLAPGAQLGRSGRDNVHSLQ